MNINSLPDVVAQDEIGVEVPIYDPAGELYLGEDGTTTTITVLGTQSKAVKKARDAQTRRFLREANQKTEPADLLANRIALASAGVVGWHGFHADGVPVPCTPANVRALLSVDERILEQVERAIDRHARFLASAKASSSST